MKVDINTQNRLKTARIKMSKTCPRHKANKTWPMVRLGDVCEIIAGLSPEGSYYTDESCYTEFHQGSKSFGTRELQVSGVYTKKETKIAKPGSLLISVRAPVGDLNITTRRVCIGRGLAALIPGDGLSRDFLWLFLTSATKAVNDAAGAGSCFSSLSRSQLSGLEIPLPPLSAQKEIVARLERELAAVEKMKKGFEALAETAKAEFKAELKEVFEELKSGGAGIGTDWTNGTHGTVETRRLGEIGRVVTGTTPSKGNKSYYGGEWPFYKPADLNQGRNTIGSGDSLTDAGWQSARQLPANSVLVTCIGATLGKTGIIRREGSCNQQINAIVCDGKALPEYVYYSILSPQFQNMLWQASNSTTLPMVNKSTFEKFEIPFPALAVQREVVARLDAAKARAEKLEAKAREGMAVCETMRKAILKEAFEGID